MRKFGINYINDNVCRPESTAHRVCIFFFSVCDIRNYKRIFLKYNRCIYLCIKHSHYVFMKNKRETWENIK